MSLAEEITSFPQASTLTVQIETHGSKLRNGFKMIRYACHLYATVVSFYRLHKNHAKNSYGEIILWLIQMQTIIK